MSEPHNAPTVGGAPPSHDHPVDFGSYVRRCAMVFVVVLVALAFMVWTSYLPEAHWSWSAKIAIILLIASINAFIVAGFLMHLISERKMVYTILAFTVSFVIGLVALTLYAMSDFPMNTVTH
jgi:heme/copper-type cytochrome/quinol oxidase subunit 4